MLSTPSDGVYNLSISIYCHCLERFGQAILTSNLNFWYWNLCLFMVFWIKLLPLEILVVFQFQICDSTWPIVLYFAKKDPHYCNSNYQAYFTQKLAPSPNSHILNPAKLWLSWSADESYLWQPSFVTELFDGNLGSFDSFHKLWGFRVYERKYNFWSSDCIS